ncbi:hypothetical protein ABEX39_26490 [Bacillus albus]|uniref:hypothetical protein n=1 Tax=Bacillus albus TaxID=2026189 RepID=UPI003D224870
MNQTKEELQEELEELQRQKISGRSALAGLGNREFDYLSRMLDDIDEKIEEIQEKLKTFDK